MSLFERFKDTKEEGFREKFVKPLLIRMGFVGISNMHGVNEFGKDYVFSELDQFGQLRHMIIQAKHEEKISQGTMVDGLVTQIRQCFYVPYTLPNAPTEQRYVSAVYVFNSGEITDNAEKQIRHFLPRELGSNTRFFSGQYLETLANSISQRQAQDVRGRFEALIHQLTLNVQIWAKLLEGINPDVPLNDQTLDLRGGILHGIEQFLSEPVLWGQIDYSAVVTLWQQTKLIQGMLMRYNPIMLTPPQEIVQRDMRQLSKLCNEAISNATQLIAASRAALQALPPPII